MKNHNEINNTNPKPETFRPGNGGLKGFLNMFYDYVIRGKSHKELQYHIVFGRETAGRGSHGQIVGTWLKEGASLPINIPFYVVGFTIPPKLNIRWMEELYHYAEMNGIVVSHLHSYGAVSAMTKQL